jgi:hypothetical protein
MADNLTEYLAGREAKGFRRVPHYFRDGDHVTFYVRDDLAFAERVDDLLTVYISEESKELVGCKIKGVRRILETLGHFCVMVEDESVRLGLLFLAGAYVTKSDDERYRQLSQLAADARLNTSEFAST